MDKNNEKIERLKYFHGQLLTENDFQDEQTYHREMRYRHNRELHSPGVVKGLIVNKTDNKQVKITAGLAIDKEGREIVVLRDQPSFPLKLDSNFNGKTVYLTIKYSEDKSVVIDDKSTRITENYDLDITEKHDLDTIEKYDLDIKEEKPAEDSSDLIIAEITLDQNSNINSVNSSPIERKTASLAPNSIGTGQIKDGAVTLKKLAVEKELDFGIRAHKTHVSCPEGTNTDDWYIFVSIVIDERDDIYKSNLEDFTTSVYAKVDKDKKGWNIYGYFKSCDGEIHNANVNYCLIKNLSNP